MEYTKRKKDSMNQQPQKILIPFGQPIPWEYMPSEVIDIPSILRERIQSLSTEQIDVTTCFDNSRQRIPGLTTIRLDDGTSYTADAELIQIATEGGGRFTRAHLNARYWVQTLAEHEAELDAEAEADYPDYW